VRLVAAIVLAVVIGSCGQSVTPTPPPATNVPCGPGEVLTRHEHAHLTILVRGQVRTVPAFIGITATQICWLHTHDTLGIIHIEAGDNRTFTLADRRRSCRQRRIHPGNGESAALHRAA
jgi:hypothetical protein